MKNSIYTIKELEEKYPEEWIGGEVLESDEFGAAAKLKLLAHSKVKDDVYDVLEQVPRGFHIAILFMGPPLREGYSAAFYEV